MKKYIQVLIPIFIFTLFSIFTFQVDAQYGGTPCSSGKTCIEAEPLGYGTKCSTTYYPEAEIKTCVGQDSSGMPVYGNCCIKAPAECNGNCYGATPSCSGIGGTTIECYPHGPSGDPLGCCVDVTYTQVDCGKNYGKDYYCGEYIDNCSGYDGPFLCGQTVKDGVYDMVGCCVPKEANEIVECQDGYGCQEICPPGGMCSAANCGPNGALWYCTYGEQDDGQVDCPDPFGCVSWENARSYCGMGGPDVSYPADCGTLGAEGCCVSGAEDEEFRDDVELPDPLEALDRAFLPDFYEDFDFELQFANIYNFMLPVGIFISLAMIVVAGYMYMTSTGQPDKVQEASKKLTSAIMGAVFISLSLVILKVIINALLGGSI